MSGIRDSTDEMLSLLREIAANTGGIEHSQNIETAATVENPTRLSSFTVVETSQMPFSDPDGTVTLDPGESGRLVEWEATGDQQIVLGIGATDRSNTAYRMVTENETKFITYSPLGMLNSPFSFKSELGFAFPAGRMVSYEAVVSDQATEAKQFAARLFVGER